MTDLILADVSEYQPNVDWDAYAASSQAAIVRACYGNHHVDTQWARNLPAVRAKLKVRGFYGYIVAGQDIPSQARLFAQLVGHLQPGEIAIADIEEGAGDQSGRAAQWGQLVHASIGGNNPWDYSGVYFDQAHNLGRIAWLAGYQQNEPSLPHILWQFTNQHAFPGIAGPCDASIFHGTADDLYRIVTPSTPAPQGGRMQPQYNPPFHLEDVVSSCPWPGGGALCLSVNGGVYNWGGAPNWGAPEANKSGENWAQLGIRGAVILPHLDGHGYIVKSDHDTDTSPGYNYRQPGF